MAADPSTGYDYYPGLSAIGIIYNGTDGVPHISNRFGHTPFPLQPQGSPINVCFSSYGLNACYDMTSNIYYISGINPYITLPETPRQHNPYTVNVVLATDLSIPDCHLICAVLEGPTEYTFDTYSFLNDRWFFYEEIDLKCYIVPNTGVSCSRFAYWLTEAPRSVIRFDVNSPDDRWQVPLDNVFLGHPETRLQLGRIGNQLGLVAVDVSFNPSVIMYLMEEGNHQPSNNRAWFQPYASINLPISNMSILRPIRFQSFKLEVFFWVDGRLMIWENSTVELQRTRLRLVNIAGAHAADGFAYVRTTLLPGNFP